MSIDKARETRWDHLARDGKLVGEFLRIMRSLHLAVGVAIDYLENQDDNEMGLTVLGVSKKEDARSIVEQQAVLLGRTELEFAILEMDPYFKKDGRVSMKTLRDKYISLKLASVVKAIAEDVNPVFQDNGGPPVFFPPGVVIDPDAVHKATHVAALLDEWASTDATRHKPSVWRQHMNCDLRCIRPGGCCPHAEECHNALKVIE